MVLLRLDERGKTRPQDSWERYSHGATIRINHYLFLDRSFVLSLYPATACGGRGLAARH